LNKIKVTAVQSRIGDLSSAERVAKIAIEDDSELLLFPEYFTYSKLSLDISGETLRFLENFSREYGVAVCGNVVVAENDSYFNRAFLFEDGELKGFQNKIHPTRNERKLGIKRGDKLELFYVRKVPVCILVCADILYPELCRVAALKGADVVLNPVVSFKHSELPGVEYRHCLYFTRSFDNCYGIVKAGGFGRTFTGSVAVGRSLIATFDGIIAKSRSEDDEEAVTAEINLDRIREYRKINYSIHDRNVNAYKELFEEKSSNSS
jgi:predicted amidohydrolase